MHRQTLLILLCMVSISAGCASSPVNEHLIRRFSAKTLKIRRPRAEGANPKASPGGLDYRADPPPTSKLDCLPPANLVKDFDFSAIQACLVQLSTPPKPKKTESKTSPPEKQKQPKKYEAHWRLARETQPKLVLDIDEEETPACLQTLLKEIPVPREIFFQYKRYQNMNCYSARVDIEANKLLGIDLPTDKEDLVIRFPLRPEVVPKSKAETQRLLISWAITPFWDSETGAIRAKYVPESICKKCLGKEFLGRFDPFQPLYPEYDKK